MHVYFSMPENSYQSVSAWFSSTVGAITQMGWQDVRALFPLALAGVIVWSLWLYRFILSRLARPIVTDFSTSTSVVVPSFHEDPDILMRCLETWRAQDPTEVIIVLDVDDLEAYERILALDDARLWPILFQHAGKRSALGVGIRAASGEVLVLTDSDTSWEPGLLADVQMPFAVADVGAVSTQQNVYQRTTSVWRRVADWLVNLRYYDYVPAMGQAGAVACVSGRTGAYRRSVVLPVLEHLENEFFLGRRCISGDDGRLTWLVLGSGYKTVHQSTARALSMFPDGFRAFVKQRVRWSRNSYRCYLTAIWKGWLWRVPFVTKITVLQILLTPVTMGVTSATSSSAGSSGRCTAWSSPWAGCCSVAASAACRTCVAIRGRSSCSRSSRSWSPHRAADQGVRLRHHEPAGLAHPPRGHGGGEGQDHASLAGGGAPPGDVGTARAARRAGAGVVPMTARPLGRRGRPDPGHRAHRLPLRPARTSPNLRPRWSNPSSPSNGPPTRAPRTRRPPSWPVRTPDWPRSARWPHCRGGPTSRCRRPTG